jgi:hypothetical protein
MVIPKLWILKSNFKFLPVNLSYFFENNDSEIEAIPILNEDEIRQFDVVIKYLNLNEFRLVRSKTARKVTVLWRFLLTGHLNVKTLREELERLRKIRLLLLDINKQKRRKKDVSSYVFV